MDWLLLIGIGLLIYSAWIWFQRNRPASPLLYDDALIELHSAIQSIKNDMISADNTSAVLPTESKKMMLSYIYQGQQLDDRTIYIHNISLTIPEQAAELLRWELPLRRRLHSLFVQFWTLHRPQLSTKPKMPFSIHQLSLSQS